MSEWQPIETAPKNGMPILVLKNEPFMADIYNGPSVAFDYEIMVVWWHDGGWRCPEYAPIGVWEPTHWMPLPKPPK